MLTTEKLTREQLDNVLDGMKNVRVGVLGDFCMDMYWYADMTRSELSRETPNFPLPITGEKMSPGAAGNVACNLLALEPASVSLFGVIGKDWRGSLLKEAFEKLGSDIHFVESADRVTNAYIKPMMKGYTDVVYEASRLDFENIRPLNETDEAALIESVDKYAEGLDVLCVCDQMRNGCITEKVRNAVEKLAEKGVKVIVDSRDNIGLYKGVIVKPNDIEAARALGGEVAPDKACELLAKKNGTLAVVTAGGDGCFVSDGEKTAHVPAFPAEPPFDICGAGDTFLSAFALGIGGMADAFDAAAAANMASAVTIKKLGMTGTASKDEIRALLEGGKNT